MTELEILNLVSDNVLSLVTAIDDISKTLTYIFITILIFYFRWEMKGGTFRK